MTYFKVKKEELVKALTIGGQFAGKNRFLTISECVKIEILGDKVRIYSTDGDNWIGKRCMIDEKKGEDYSFCVSLKNIMPYVKNCGSIVTFNIDKDKGMLNIEHVSGTASFPILSSDNFQEEPHIIDSETSFGIKSSLMNEWVRNCSPFIARNELKQVLCGMYLYIHDNKIEYCATDGFAMITECLDYDYENKSANVIIRSGIFRAISDITADTENTKISFDRNVIKIQSGNAIILSKQIEGLYPNFHSIIPKTHNYEKIIDKNDIIKSINRLNSISNTSSDGLLKFNFTNEGLTINCVDIDFGISGDERLVCGGDGDCLIGFKGEKISDAMNGISTDNAIFYLLDGTKAAIIQNDNEKSTLKILIMPTQIN